MQIVYIDLIPQKEKPIVNLSQYDNDRLVRFMLLENGEEYTLTGTETIDVNIRKPDGNIVVITPTVTANHYVDVLFTEQAAACYGLSVGELSIKENSTIIGTCNFIMDVEKSPTCGGIQSATEIENLQSQIDDIISGEGYLKAEDVAQVALSGDYNDLTNKPDMLDYYTKSQTDALLNNKVDNSTLGSYYTKSQTEALIDDRLLAIMPVETATGNPCSFDTDIAAELHGLTAEIVASGGGGTPQVPNPIVGHSEINLDVNGDTFTVQFGQTVYGGELDVTSGVLTITHGYVDLGSLTWIAAITNVTGKVRMRAALTHKAVPNSVVFNANCDIYKAITASETYTCVDGISGENTGSYIFVYDSNYSTTADLSAFTSMVNGHYLAYELATPIEIDVSELSVDTIVGTNNITSDCNGDVTASYKVSTQKYIDDRT